MNWQYNKESDAFVFGDRNNGGGVFQDLQQDVDGKSWYGNSVVDDIIGIVMVGPFSTKEEAQNAVKENFTRRKNQN